MPTIKIISNPYQKRTTFQQFDEDDQLWIDITVENCPNSKLLSNKLIRGFFPFVVKDIVDIINVEYHINDDIIDIVFEGAEDEYKELEELCKSDEYVDKVKLSKSDCYLENAHNILPEINDLYNKEICPLINSSVTNDEKISKEIARFSDASNDIIPLCILGNSKAGKSTFINALIGREILPGVDDSVTAKIYRIKESDFIDRAYIRLSYNQKPIKIEFDENNFTIQSDSNSLTEQIAVALTASETDSMTAYIHRTLAVINDFSLHNADTVSDVIEIEVPFVSEVLRNSSKKFYIFDTPGINSASNTKWLCVLKRAMAELSNGLAIFISEFEALDNSDNINLYKEIEKMDEIDNRFTMIIINKSDVVESDQREKESILKQAIPQNLYKGGIYFVSSIIGLGAKNKGTFINDRYAKSFNEKHTLFKTSYKKLYQYNIIPKQLKNQYQKDAESVSDLLFVNSGLYTAEQAILKFADTYSSYNKCQQACLYLNRAIEIVRKDLTSAKARREAKKHAMNNELEENKKRLIIQIENKSIDSQAEFSKEYNLLMREISQTVDLGFSVDEIKQSETTIKSTQKDNHSYGERTAAVKKSSSNLSENILKAFRKDGKNLKDLIGDFNDIKEKLEDLRDTKKKINQETAENLIKDVTKRFHSCFEAAQNILDNYSKEFWNEKSRYLKSLLIAIVTETTAENEEQRREFSHILMTYDDIDFDAQTATKLPQEEFKRGIKLGHFDFYESDKINIDRLAKRYSADMTRKITEICNIIQSSHIKSFKAWIDRLVSELRDNIVQNNPTLTKKAQEIKQEESKISELEEKLDEFAFYTKKITEMIEWKTF